ncbi:hemolysin family protein [Pleurocapsa sp. PCC 7319]|uniref:hemolysin family protein n=1 Tax=Pleurocapsa sp. PCC 7319 TaxID=118161 RepID=UPI00034501FC|nr:hemolysin family protein [Pleurocapsa sp. PCC 7319]
MVGQNLLLTFVGVFLLIAINAFFVTAEFSIVSVRRSRISQLVREGDIQAQTVQSLQRSIDRLLSTTQLGITLSSLALGWVGEKTMAVSIVAIIQRLSLPSFVSKAIAHSLAIPLAFVILAYLQIVLGELCPKSVALMYPEKLARFFGPPSVVIARIFRPFVAILNLSTRLLLKLVGVEYSGQGWYKKVTSEELQLIIATDRESIGLEAEERQLLKNVFDFHDDTAEQVMIPRTDIKFLSLTTTFEELLQTVAETGYSGYPVIGDSLDDIQGIIHYKKLSEPLAKGQLSNESTIEPWIKPVSFIPESTFLNELLPMMQRSHQKMVIVIDEFGGTSGLITLHDLVAEIVGDAGSDPETGIEAIQELDENTFLVSAQMNLEEVNEQLDLDLPLADNYNTLGGFLLEQWQKIPQQGEKLQYEDLDFTVTIADSNRLYQILIHR